MNETLDEDGNTTREYKDKQGQVVLKESMLGSSWLQTFYIYDDFGLLRCVVPPKASNPSDNQLCFYYKYDERKRMVEKKIPGGGIIKMVYDQRDRLRCTQNSEQAVNNDWSFTKYDELNRPVITGVLKNYTTDITPDIATAVTTGTISETWDVTPKAYTNVSFPGPDLTTEIQSVTYYDNYDFLATVNDSLDFGTYTDIYGFNSKKTDNPKGRVTGIMTRVLMDESNTTIKPELYSAVYYDKYGHTLRTISENHLYGKDVISNDYEDITWQLMHTRQEHYKGAEKVTIDQSMEYDHTGRLLATEQKVNDQAPVTLSAMKYNEVGQMIKKYLHSDKTSGTRDFLQKVDYTYNIRGWLTGINDPGLGQDNDLFGMALCYQDLTNMGTYSGGQANFNGNISGMKWGIKNDVIRGYKFGYDQLNRLLQAQYGEGATLNTSTGYNNEMASYDNNGNISNLQRFYNNSQVDMLIYNYNNNSKSNQIQTISDYGTNSASVHDYHASGASYTYDTNGNTRFDAGRNATFYYHPTLNLPKVVDFGTNHQIHYYYTAGGGKLVKHVQDGSSNTYTHYIGNVVYEKGALSYIATGESRLVAIGSGTNRTFVNEYALKDHLGNSRVAFMGTNLGGAVDVVQTTNYYPFGLVMTQSNTNPDPSYAKNKYLYNGKELQDETLNGTFFGMEDYGARFYDPQIARWTTPDPLAEKYRRWSPYNYCVDNPLRFRDPDGMKIAGATEDDAQKMQEQMRKTLGDKITDKFFKLGKDGKTYEKINKKDFNKAINDKGSGLSKEQKAMANGFMKAVNAGYTINVEFGEGGSRFTPTSETTGTAKIGSDNQSFSDTKGNSRESTLTQRFVHEVLGEGVAAGNTGDMTKLQRIEDSYGTDRNGARSDPTIHGANLQIIQTENLYNAQFGYQRSGTDHGLTVNDQAKVSNIPSIFSSTYYVEGDWTWTSK